MTSCDFDIQPKVIIFSVHSRILYKPCVYICDVYAMLSFGGVCEVTDKQTYFHTDRHRRVDTNNIIGCFIYCVLSVSLE